MPILDAELPSLPDLQKGLKLFFPGTKILMKKIENGWDEPLQRELDQVGWGESIPKFKSLGHEQNWCEGRRLLLGLHRSFGRAMQWNLTHSAGVVLAVAGNGPPSIGVDLERADRSMSPRAERRVIAPHEKKFSLSPLELWVIKESLFKAGSTGGVVWDWEVVQWDPARGEGVGQSRMFGQRPFLKMLSNGWVVSFSKTGSTV